MCWQSKPDYQGKVGSDEEEDEEEAEEGEDGNEDASQSEQSDDDSDFEDDLFTEAMVCDASGAGPSRGKGKAKSRTASKPKAVATTTVAKSNSIRPTPCQPRHKSPVTPSAWGALTSHAITGGADRTRVQLGIDQPNSYSLSELKQFESLGNRKIGER